MGSVSNFCDCLNTQNSSFDIIQNMVFTKRTLTNNSKREFITITLNNDMSIEDLIKKQAINKIIRAYREYKLYKEEKLKYKTENPNKDFQNGEDNYHSNEIQNNENIETYNNYSKNRDIISDDIKRERDILENKIEDLNKEKDDIKREKDILVNHIENLNKEKEELIKSRGKYSLLPIKPGEKIITINFVSIGNQDIVNFGLTCKNTDLFIREEERLYEAFPKFKNENTYFQVNTREIKRFLTLDQNGIKDNDIINMFVNS